jgi:hypothetical protein
MYEMRKKEEMHRSYLHLLDATAVLVVTGQHILGKEV